MWFRAVVVVACVWGGASLALNAQQQCDENCKPAISSRPTEPEPISVCFKEGQFDSYGTAKSQIEAGVNYWKNWLVNNDITSDITFRTGTTQNPCSSTTDRVTVSVNSGLPLDVPGQASANGNMELNPAYLAAANQSTMNWTGAHEMGHVLGFAHSGPGCASDSVMVESVPGNFTLGGVLCADLIGLTKLYFEDDDYDEEIEEPADGTDPAYEDCFNVIRITWTYWYDANGNYHEKVTGWEIVRWYCDPLPESP